VLLRRHADAEPYANAYAFSHAHGDTDADANSRTDADARANGYPAVDNRYAGLSVREPGGVSVRDRPRADVGSALSMPER
jgi:hypothetical protein